MKQSAGFIGGGRVTKILLQAFSNKNVQFSKIVVTDTNQDVLNNLIKLFPSVRAGDAAEAAGQDIVFIALHPPVLMDTLESVKEKIKPDSVVISLAP